MSGGTRRGLKAGYERCRNPWNGTCKSTQILLYIYHDGRRLPICRDCWDKIADKKLEWSING